MALCKYCTWYLNDFINFMVSSHLWPFPIYKNLLQSNLHFNQTSISSTVASFNIDPAFRRGGLHGRDRHRTTEVELFQHLRHWLNNSESCEGSLDNLVIKLFFFQNSTNQNSSTLSKQNPTLSSLGILEGMRELGAEVVPVKSGSRTLKDAVNEANMVCWSTNASNEVAVNLRRPCVLGFFGWVVVVVVVVVVMFMLVVYSDTYSYSYFFCFRMLRYVLSNFPNPTSYWFSFGHDNQRVSMSTSIKSSSDRRNWTNHSTWTCEYTLGRFPRPTKTI